MSIKKRDHKKRILRDGESQRADGRYMYRYRDASGERKTVYSWRLVETDEYLSGKKKDMSLREKEALIQKELMEGINLTGATITLNELFERYMRIKKKLANNTRETYQILYGKHVSSYYIGNMQIKSINRSDILNLYENLSDSMLSNGTIQNIHNGILHPMLQLAVDNDWLRKNPADNCLKEYPYDVMDKRDALTLEEQQIFIEFLKMDKVYKKYLPIVILMIETALRRGEVLGLTWNDVDLKNRLIKIDHQLHYYSVNGKYKIEMGVPKTKSGNRIIPLSKEAISILQRVKEKEYFNSAGSNVMVDGYKDFVFLNSRKNNVILPRQLSDALMAASKKCNEKTIEYATQENIHPKLLPEITPHVLRHTACTRMAEAGMDVKVLQAIMGHKKAEMTMNIYNHVDLNRITKEIEKIDTLEAPYLLG